MKKEQIREAINDFISLIEIGNNDDQENVSALELILDRLALAYHYADVLFEDFDTNAPSGDYDHLRELATARFPHFGYYNEPNNITENIGETEIIIGDAIDDLADIAQELYEVLWYWENTGEKAALFQFCSGYKFHWGAHLRGLQSYLYYLRYR